jgi:KDO2-lipid IV(A) lauroyltransferase
VSAPFLRRLEYVLFRAVESFSRMLGPAAAYEAGARLGRAGFALMRRRRRLALRNIARALPLLTPGTDPTRTARAAFEHFAGSMMEAMATTGAGAVDSVRFEQLHLARRALARGRGVVAVIAHLGNWELAGIAAARLPIPIVSVARRAHNDVIERYLRRARARTGQQVCSDRGTIHRLARLLSRNTMLIIPSDQWPKRGARVSFFGRTTLALRTPAVLALRCGAPVLPINIYRERTRPPRHCVELTPLIEPEEFREEPNPVEALSRRIARRLESFVRRHPEQWTWGHDRWKPLPPEVGPAESAAAIRYGFLSSSRIAAAAER